MKGNERSERRAKEGKVRDRKERKGMVGEMGRSQICCFLGHAKGLTLSNKQHCVHL